MSQVHAAKPIDHRVSIGSSAWALLTTKLAQKNATDNKPEKVAQYIQGYTQ